MAARQELKRNPFHSAQEEQPERRDLDEDLGDDLLGPSGQIEGPSLPPGAPSPAGPRFLVASGIAPPETITVAGLHGGSGATTVRRVLERHSEPFAWMEAPHRGVVPERGAAIFVARTSGVGLEQASRAAREWGDGSLGGLALLGIVLVADGPRTDPQLRAATKRVARMYPRAWRVEWVPEWHLTAEPDLERIPRKVRGMRKNITAWATERGLAATPKEMK